VPDNHFAVFLYPTNKPMTYSNRRKSGFLFNTLLAVLAVGPPKLVNHQSAGQIGGFVYWLETQINSKDILAVYLWLIKASF